MKLAFCVLLTAFAGVASAADLPKLPAPPAKQIPRQPTYRNLLKHAAVQAEIKLTDEQFSDAELWGTDCAKKTGVAVKELKKTAKDSVDTFLELLDKGDKEYRYGLERRLKEEQIKRLGQIRVQADGIGAMEWPEVAGPLKLTAAQKKDVAKIVEKYEVDRREMAAALDKAGEFFPEGGRKFYEKDRELRTAALKDVAKLLMPDQTKRWKEVFGEPFDLSKLGPPNLPK